MLYLVQPTLFRKVYEVLMDSLKSPKNILYFMLII